MKMKTVFRENRGGKALCSVERFGPETAKRTRRFHESFPEYQLTPLAALYDLAKRVGVASIYVKDESRRFGLNAFKVLGGSYAIGNCIAKRLGVSLEELPFGELLSGGANGKLGELTFATATDGNHGRASRGRRSVWG